MKYGLKGASSGPAGSRLRAVGRNSYRNSKHSVD